MSGISFITTPIGNEGDISLNAINSLKDCDVLVCEDTRVTKDLLKRLNIDFVDKQMISFNDHSDENNISGIVSLSQTKKVSFVSDAGSPLISDPAYPMIRFLVENGHEFNCIGGVSSLNLALEYSGLPITPFHFHGFCGRDKAKLNKFISTISCQYGTHVFYEGVSRVKSTLEFMCNQLADCDFVVARELTKTFQSIHRFKGNDLDKIIDEIVFKGEFVILIHNPLESKATSGDLIDLANEIINGGAKPKKIAKLLSLITDQKTKDIYDKMRD